MEIILEPGCTRQEELYRCKALIEDLFNKLFEELKLTTIKKIVITNNDQHEYVKSVKGHAEYLDRNIHLTNDENYQGSATVIHGLDEFGALQQILFMKDFIYFSFCYSVMNKELSKQEDQDFLILSKEITFHEIGHALNYQQMFEVYGYSTPDKQFDLSYEYEEYIMHESLQLWSEYYAQRIASAFLEKPLPTHLRDLVDFMKIKPLDNIFLKQLYHSYRIAYFFLLYIAYFHCNGEQTDFYQKFSEDKVVSAYFEAFKPLADIMDDLFIRNNTWDFDNDCKKLKFAYEKLIIVDRDLCRF